MTLRLRTFGSVYLSNDGDILSGAAAQRRLLAILTILSAVGERGISRDKVLGLLWSEGDPEKARHALTQSLYHIRKALGGEQIFLSGADLRIKPGVIQSDVGDFQLALQQSRFADAVAAYTGAFLDGFYLNGDPEFDFWVAAERDKFARQYADALRALADAARADGNLEEQLRWRTALAEHDPLDGAATAQLVTCLIAAGDYAAALQRARVHETRMRAELDLPPDRAVVELVAGLRRDTPRPSDAAPLVPQEASDSPERSIEATPLPAVRAKPQSLVVEAPLDVPSVVVESREARSPRRWRSAVWIAVAATIVGVVGVVRATTSRRANSRAAVRGSTIMVAPFRVSATDPATAYLREGLLDLLTTRIADADTKRAADPTVVLRAWRAAGFDRDIPVSNLEASRVARELNAGELVVGSVESSTAGVTVHATLIDAFTGRSRGTANVSGSPDSLIVLTDRIISSLILTEAGDGLAALSQTSVSPAGLRAYLAGRSAYRSADYYRAVRANEQALAHDPGFALAAFSLAIAADRANVAEQHDRGLAIAWANQSSLGPADRAYLHAFAGPRYPEPSSAAEALAAWERVVHVAPDRPEGWYALGESFYYDGELLGMRDGQARADEAFRHALRLDPSFAPARRMLTLLLAREQDTVGLRTLLAEQQPRDTADDMSVFVRWRAANALGDTRTLSRLRRSFEKASNGALRAIAMTSQFDGVSIEDGDRALELLRRRPLSDAELLDVDLARHSRALNSGDFAAAKAIGDEIGMRRPSLHTQLRLRVLDGLYSGGDRDTARAAASQLSRLVAAGTPVARADSAVRAADACVAAQWQLSVHDTAAARASWRLLRSGGISRFPVPVGASPSACAELIDATLAIAERGAAARDRLAHLDSLMLSGPTVNDAMRYANLVLARQYQAIGDFPHAVAALQRRSYMRGWPRYRATGLRLLADLSLQLGDSATARSAIERIMATRRPTMVAAASPPIVVRWRSFSHRIGRRVGLH